jgi:RimJ/RimL family protein N-acetyltransferase
MGVWRDVELMDVGLETDRLILRPLAETDAPVVHAAMQNRDMHRFLVLPDPYTEADAHQYVTEIAQRGRHDGTAMELGLVERANGRLVGTVALRLPAGHLDTAAEIGYAVYPDGQGNHYAAEAARAVVTWAFDHDVVRVEIRCHPANLASVKVALRAGFRYEGIGRATHMIASGPADAAFFARLPADSGESIPPMATPLPPAGLSDGVLRLRVRRLADLDAVMEEENDPETLRWGFSDRPPQREEVAARLDRAGLEWLVGPGLSMSMVDVATGEVAGSIQVRLSGPPGVGLVGYGVRPSYRGRGYTTRALRLVRQWAFDEGGFTRLELGAKVGNIASHKAAQHAGFDPDGIRMARLRNPHGSFSDEARFAAINPKAQLAETGESVSRIRP